MKKMKKKMKSILVVDDERSIRIPAQVFLEAEDYSVDIAEDAKAALEVLRSKSIDVVLTDIILPGMSGLDLLRRIREMSLDIQVIMMTGEPNLETASEALRLGALDYLQKPIGKNGLLKAVRNALKIKDLSDEKRRLEKENQNYMNHLEQLVRERTQALANSETSLSYRIKELSALNNLSRKVNESITVEDVIQFGLSEIAHAAATDFTVLFLGTGEDLTLKYISPESVKNLWEPKVLHPVGNCLCVLAAKTGKPYYASDIRSDPRCTMEECLKAGFHCFAAIPLLSGSETIGVLGFGSIEGGNFHEHASFLEAFATEMSIGLKKSLLYEQVQQHAFDLQTSLTRTKEAEAERIKLEKHLQRSQRMEAIGVLASGIAHDFNNILSAVIGYTELAMMDIGDAERSRRSLEMVLTAGERAKDLVKHILTFGRQSEDARKPIQMVHIVKEVIKFIRASLPSTIAIHQKMDSDIPNIRGDPVQIHQVLMNLCTNAHHAMREKGGVLEIRLGSVDIGSERVSINPDFKPGTYVRLTVKDTGHGMDPATAKKVFEPYFTTKEKGVGTGLGLAVVHGIVQKYGGAIELTSEPGKGSIFDLFFPAIGKEGGKTLLRRQEIPTGHEQVLFIDDEKVLVDIGRQMLESLGYTVEARTSSIEALALFRAHPDRFDIVITDVTIPNMAGDELAVELMKIRADIPIILCTGQSDRISEERSRAIGIRAFVMKPILMAELARVIRDVLEEKQAGR